MKRLLFILGIAAAVLSACSSSSEEEQKAKLDATPKNIPIETGKDVEILYTDSGLPKAKVKAPLLERYSGDRSVTEMRKGINVVFLTRNQEVESFLSANYAIRYDRLKKMTARNNVVVRNVDGDTLRTEELVWDESTQQVSSNKFVTITTKDEIIMGDGFQSDVSFKNPKIFKIRGIVNLK